MQHDTWSQKAGTTPEPVKEAKNELAVRYLKNSKTIVLGKLKVTARFISIGQRASKCDDICPCTCHVISSSKYRGLEKKSVVTLKRPQLVGNCSYFKCQRLDVRKRQVIIQRLGSVMKEYALALVQRGSMMSVELKSRPIIPETSDAIRFCQIGDFESLKELIVTGKASPFDTGIDGWTLLHVGLFLGKSKCYC